MIHRMFRHLIILMKRQKKTSIWIINTYIYICESYRIEFFPNSNLWPAGYFESRTSLNVYAIEDLGMSRNISNFELPAVESICLIIINKLL